MIPGKPQTVVAWLLIVVTAPTLLQFNDSGSTLAGMPRAPSGKPSAFLDPADQDMVEDSRRSENRASAAKLGPVSIQQPQVDRRELTIAAHFSMGQDAANGVLVCQGGSERGYTIFLRQGKIIFGIRRRGELAQTTPVQLETGEHRFIARLTLDGRMLLSIDETLVARHDGRGWLESQPGEPLTIGKDSHSNVGDYQGSFPFDGKIDSVFVNGVRVDADPSAVAEIPPNLVVIIADDCTYLDLGTYGGQAHTPNLDKLAAAGMTFSRCFQAAPMCSPTRHNIYTGIYPVKSGAWPNHTFVYPGTRSIAHYLQQVGYRVALSGKTHIAPRESFPFEYNKEFRTADPSSPNPYPELKRLIEQSTQAGNPFCIFACSNEPHSPYTKGNASAYPPDSLKLPPSWVDTPETRTEYSRYLAEVTYFDAQCGALLRLLDDQGVSDHTLVMVISEQGSGFPFAKWTCYEMGLASGLIARWPGRIEPGTTADALVEYCDISPTLMAAAGVVEPPTMDGRSFLNVLTGVASEHRKFTFGIHTTRGIINGSEQFGIRSCATKTHRYIRNLHSSELFTNAVTRKRGDHADFWSSWVAAAALDQKASVLVNRYQRRPAEELYDVANDPHCLHNLIDDPRLAETRNQLSGQLDAWMKSQGDSGHAIEAKAHERLNANRRKSGKPRGKQATGK